MNAIPKLHHPHDRKWIEKQIDPFPAAMSRFLAAEYEHTFDESGRRAANLQLLQTHDDVDTGKIHLATDEDAIRAHADRLANECRTAAARLTVQRAFRFFLSVTAEVRVSLPTAQHLPGMAARLADPLWWRRNLRAGQGRAMENVARRLGMTHRQAGIYVSDDTVRRRAGQRSRNREMLEAMIAVNELGQEYTIQELADLGISNPAIRRAELMTRIAGFQALAQQEGHEALFLTVTCPSRFHAHHVSGERNSRWDGSTPRDAAQYLARIWARARAALGRHGIRPYGLRVAEPHHDGTPHWHLLLFVQPQQADRLSQIVRHYALQDSPDEEGAEKYRFRDVRIDAAKGTATGYVAKYIAKMIDGHGMERDLYGVDINDAVRRVDAWASTWGIRQFQQVGGPPVTLWREARRLDADERRGGVIDRIVQACNAGKGRWSQGWAAFAEAMGGVGQGRRGAPAWLHRERHGDVNTGEVMPNKYGEIAAARITGIADDWGVVITRIHKWVIERRARSVPVFDFGFVPPRSPVNNCTVQKNFRFDDATMGEIIEERERLSKRPKISMLDAMIQRLRQRRRSNE